MASRAATSASTAGCSRSASSSTTATCTAVGKVSLLDWLRLTWSFGCTGDLLPELTPRISIARLAMTSLAFMLLCVPDPVWNTTSGKWSSSSPRATSSAACTTARATSASSSPRSAFASAADFLSRPSPGSPGGPTRRCRARCRSARGCAASARPSTGPRAPRRRPSCRVRCGSVITPPYAGRRRLRGRGAPRPTRRGTPANEVRDRPPGADTGHGVTAAVGSSGRGSSGPGVVGDVDPGVRVRRAGRGTRRSPAAEGRAAAVESSAPPRPTAPRGIRRRPSGRRAVSALLGDPVDAVEDAGTDLADVGVVLAVGLLVDLGAGLVEGGLDALAVLGGVLAGGAAATRR